MRGGGRIVGAALLLAGCSGSGGPLLPDPGTGSSTTATASSVLASAKPSTSNAPSPSSSSTGPRSCFDRVLDATTVHVKGSRGSVHWDLAIPEFSGARSADEVNRHVRASAQDAIDSGLDGGSNGYTVTVTGKATVMVNDRRTVQVELVWDEFAKGSAHSSPVVATTVVTTDRGAPVRLRDVLVDEKGSLQIVATAISKQASEKGEDVAEPNGLAPKETNFAAWQATSKGFRFGFQDYQLGGHGLRSYTVPWQTMRPLLSDEGTGLLDPDIDPTTC